MRTVPVGVIIPCYRSDLTVERAVASVLAQTALPQELWLVDDASPDEGRTLSTLRRIQAENSTPVQIHVISSEVNVGPGEARRLAWDRTRLPYVAFLDSDDAWHPQKLEIQYEWMEAHPEVVLSSHGDVFARPGPLPCFDDSDPPVVEITRGTILTTNVVSTRTVMMRSDVPFRFPRQKRYADDFHLWLDVVLSGERAVILDLPLAYHFRPAFSSGGVSAELWAMWRGELSTYIHFFRTGRIRARELPFLLTLSAGKFGRRLLIQAVRG